MNENVQFEENNYQANNYQTPTESKSRIVNCMVRNGVVKTPEAAQKFLIIVTVIIFAIAIIIAYRALNPSVDTDITNDNLPTETLVENLDN